MTYDKTDYPVYHQYIKFILFYLLIPYSKFNARIRFVDQRYECQQERLVFPTWKQAARLMCHCHFCPFLIVQSIAIDRSARHMTFLVQGNRILKGKDCIRPCLPFEKIDVKNEEEKEKWRRSETRPLFRVTCMIDPLFLKNGRRGHFASSMSI